MKRIYLLLTAALLGIAAASAAMPQMPDAKNVYIAPEAAAKLKAKVNAPMTDKLADPSLEIMTRSWYDYSGYKYYFTMFLDKDQRWCDTLRYTDKITGEEKQYTFEEFPFYIVWFQMTIVSNTTLKTYGYIPQFAFWPCYFYWEQGFVDGWNIPVEERNLNPVLPMDLCNNPNNCRKFEEQPLIEGMYLDVNPGYSEDGMAIEYWAIANQDYMNTVTDDAQVIYKQDYFGSTNCTESSKSNIVFNYLTEDDQLSMNYTAYIWVLINGSKSSTPLRVRNYVGDTKVDAFYKKDIVCPVTDLHIFNAGVVSSETITDKAKDPYFYPWGPVHQYYVMGVGNEYMKVVLKDETDIKFNIENINVGYKDDTPADQYYNPATLTYFNGTLYSTPQSESPYGHWTVQQPYYVDDPEFQVVLGMVPEAGTAMPCYDWISEEMQAKEKEYGQPHTDVTYDDIDGFTLNISSVKAMLMAGGLIGNGTTDGFIISGHDQFDNNLSAKYNGLISYHSDPNDMNKVDMIESLGDRDGVVEAAAPAVAIMAANGQVIVSAPATCEVAVYDLNGRAVYNGLVLGGQTVNIALPGGFYVVKAGDAVKKVVL